MANYSAIKATINANIRTNGNQEITGSVLNSVLTAMVNTLGAGFQYAGVASPSTNPGTPDAKVFYLAATAGTYSHFGGLTLSDGEVAVLKYETSWSKDLTGCATAAQMNDLMQQINGLNLLGSQVFSGNQEKRVLNNILIPAGTPFSIKVYSDSVSWTRVGVTANNGWGAGVTLRDQVQNGVTYDIPAQSVDITSIYVFIISGFSGGSGSVYMEVKSGDGIVQQINTILNDISNLEGRMDQIEGDVNSIITEVYGKNLLNTSAITLNKWIGRGGALENVTSDFGATDYIPVTPGQAYHLSNKNGVALCDRTDAYIAFYDSSKVCLGTSYSVASNNTDVTAPAGSAFMRVSLRMNRVTGMDAQIEKGSARTAYVPYVAPREAVNPDLIVLPEDSVDTENLKDGSVTRSKIAEGVTFPAAPVPFGSIRVSQSNLAAGSSLETEKYYRISKDILLSAIILGSIEKVQVGIGYLSSIGEWLEITPTELKTCYGSAGTTHQTFTHGLTLGNRTSVIIEKTISAPSSVAQAIVRIMDDYGNIFQQIVTWWGSVSGLPFIRNNNASSTLNVSLSFMVRDITKKIWMFGDSYFNYDGNTRWPYYPINWGFTNFLLNGKQGENATEAFEDFNNLLAFGKTPAIAVWCLGMNGGRDTNGAVNTTWLAMTNAFLALCEEKGIMPILATIPSVPTEIHTKLNEWVRASGHRYIDFAEAVEQSGTNTWRGWGTANALLSSDQVHPSAHGAAELASRVFQDFPEISSCED